MRLIERMFCHYRSKIQKMKAKRNLSAHPVDVESGCAQNG